MVWSGLEWYAIFDLIEHEVIEYYDMTMYMRTLTLLVLALAAAAPAAAFRPRPVSDLQFENRFAGTYAPSAVAAASDGDDYLVLLQQFLGGTYTQAVSHGVPYGPPVLIGMGTGYSTTGSVVWTGSQYLVAWANKDGVCLTAVSRSGALLSGPRQIIAGNNLSAKAVSDGRRILVTAKAPTTGLSAVLVDLSGQPVGEVIIAAPGLLDYAITGTNDGFAIATFGYTDTRVFRFDDAGQQIVAGGTRLEGPYVGHADTYYTVTGTLTSDGTNVAVIFSGVHYQSPSQLRTAIVGSRGEIVEPPRTILTGLADQSGITPTSALWNGTEYITTLSLRRDINAIQVDPVMQRVSRTGEGIEGPSPLLVATGRREPSAMASNGREYLITLEQPAGTFFVRIPLGSTAPSEPIELTTRLLNTQQAPVIAGGRRDYLTAWIETDRNGSTLRASRIDTSGRYLDGAGIVVATFPTSSVPPQISIDSDGENWLVVWTANYAVKGRRVSAAGVLLDPQPISISGGSQAVVRWGHGSWLVVSTIGDRPLTGTAVTRDGVPGTSTLLSQAPSGSYYDSPALAFDGQAFFLALSLHTPWCATAVQPYCSEFISIATMQLDPISQTVVSTYTLSPDDAATSSLAVAANGSRHLVVYQQSGKVAGALFNEGSAPTKIAISDRWASFAAMWSGSDFVVALSSRASYPTSAQLQVVRVSSQGIVGSTLTVPFDSTERPLSAALPPSFPTEQATPPSSGPPFAFLTQNDTYDAIPRAAFAFAFGLDDSLRTTQIPPAPSIGRAIVDRDGVTLSWMPQANVLGFSIELRQSDGGERVIGVAAGGASSAHLAYPGLVGTTLRLRAWNAAGLSSPSSEVQPTTRVRAVGR